MFGVEGITTHRVAAPTHVDLARLSRAWSGGRGTPMWLGNRIDPFPGTVDGRVGDSVGSRVTGMSNTVYVMV